MFATFEDDLAGKIDQRADPLLTLNRQRMFKYQSGRVISLGRAMFAVLFLLTIWLEGNPHSRSDNHTLSVLSGYLLFVIITAAATWRNWWLDARLAAPGHLIDMAVFTAIVFAENGYTSPFFLFFVLPLLSAAIRWGWRETRLTAMALITLYLIAGLLVSGSETFELQRFTVRSGHLVILSMLLIWFGTHQQFSRLFLGPEELQPSEPRRQDSFEQALSLAMRAAGAQSGALVLGDADQDWFTGIQSSGGKVSPTQVPNPLPTSAHSVLLFDLRRNRSLFRSSNWFCFRRASNILDVDAISQIGIDSGLLVKVQSSTQPGWLFLWQVAGLSADFLQLGPELGRAAASVIDRGELLWAIEERSAASTRLSLARDLHDSIVQFLAGAAFRVEAIRRRMGDRSEFEPDLDELKKLLMQEQMQIRSFVTALRRDRELEFNEAIEELRSLALRLQRQWNIECDVMATATDRTIPAQVQLDLQLLMQEAVANAVRHGGASTIEVRVEADAGQLFLEVRDDGSGIGALSSSSRVEPWSIKERLDRAGGSLSLTSTAGATTLSMSLPLRS